MVLGQCVSQVGFLGQLTCLWRSMFPINFHCFLCVVEGLLQCVSNYAPLCSVYFSDSLLPALEFLTRFHPLYLPYLQMKNLDAEMCLDQGPVPGHRPIAYTCHYYSPQVRRTAKHGLVSLKSGKIVYPCRAQSVSFCC